MCTCFEDSNPSGSVTVRVVVIADKVHDQQNHSGSQDGVVAEQVDCFSADFIAAEEHGEVSQKFYKTDEGSVDVDIGDAQILVEKTGCAVDDVNREHERGGLEELKGIFAGHKRWLFGVDDLFLILAFSWYYFAVFNYVVALVGGAMLNVFNKNFV